MCVNSSEKTLTFFSNQTTIKNTVGGAKTIAFSSKKWEFFS